MKIKALKTLVLPNGRTIAEGDIVDNPVGIPAEMMQFCEVVKDDVKEEQKDSGKTAGKANPKRR